MEVVEKEYYLNEQQFATLTLSWALLSAEKMLTRADMVLYNVLRGKDIRRGFIAKRSHVQGNDPWFAFEMAKREAKVLVKHNFAKHFGFEPPVDLLARIDAYLYCQA